MMTGREERIVMIVMIDCKAFHIHRLVAYVSGIWGKMIE